MKERSKVLQFVCISTMTPSYADYVTLGTRTLEAKLDEIEILVVLK